MKILDLTFPDPPLTVVEAVHFDPWPFVEERIEIKDARFIDADGYLSPVFEMRAFSPDTWDVLCRMSDGTLAVTHLDGLGNFTNQGRS